MLTSLSLKDSGHYFSQITYWPHWRLRDNHTHITLDLDPEEQKSMRHSTQMPHTWQGTIGIKWAPDLEHSSFAQSEHCLH